MRKRGTRAALTSVAIAGMLVIGLLIAGTLLRMHSDGLSATSAFKAFVTDTFRPGTDK